MRYIIILSICVFSHFGNATAQPLGTDNLTTSINNGLSATVVGITAAMNQAVDRLGLILERQSQLTIGSLDLNGRISNLDAIVQKNLSSLQNDLRNISNQIVIASNSIPFSKKYPQVSSLLPANKDQNNISLTVNGNFADLRRPKYNAYLTKGPVNIGFAEQKFNNLLVFSINKTQLVYDPNAITDNYFNLVIPYKGFLRTKYVSYVIDVKTYPAVLGQVELYQTTTTRSREVKQFISGEINQASDHDDKKDVLHCVSPDDGYLVDKSTIDKVIVWSQGEQGNDKDFWFGDNSNSTPGNACFTLTTIHHGIGTSGKVTFKIKFDEYRNVETTAESLSSTTRIDDGFIASVRLPFILSRIRFTQFDGKVYEFDSNFETDFLKFLRNGNYLYIQRK